MTGIHASGTAEAVAGIGALIGGVEQRLSGWAGEVGEQLAALSGKVTGTAIDKIIRPTVEMLLAGDGSYVAGAGFIANAGLLGPERSYIAWWQGLELERVDALANFSPNSVSRYVKAEWFRIPVETGRPHVTGPYVDFLCTDEYVLTFTHPVFTAPGAPVAGIVGVDVTVQSVERAVRAPLRAVGPQATLVNAEGRAIASASPAIEAGDLAAAADGAAVTPVGSRIRILHAARPL